MLGTLIMHTAVKSIAYQKIITRVRVPIGCFLHPSSFKTLLAYPIKEKVLYKKHTTDTRPKNQSNLHGLRDIHRFKWLQ